MRRTFMQGQLPLTGLAVLICVALIAGCNGELNPQARELLLSAYESYEIGDDAAVRQQTDEFLTTYGRSARADEAHYLRGMTRLRQKDTAGGKSDLDEALALTSHDNLRANALVALGDLAYDVQDMALAENKYRQALAHAEEGVEPSGHAHYRLGSVLQRQGRWREADAEFNSVMHHWPDSALGAASAAKTHSTAWTLQAGSFRDKRRADAEARRLRAKGWSASVRPSTIKNQLVFRVQIGRYATYEQAFAAQPKAEQDAKGAFVTVTR